MAKRKVNKSLTDATEIVITNPAITVLAGEIDYRDFFMCRGIVYFVTTDGDYVSISDGSGGTVDEDDVVQHVTAKLKFTVVE